MADIEVKKRKITRDDDCTPKETFSAVDKPAEQKTTPIERESVSNKVPYKILSDIRPSYSADKPSSPTIPNTVKEPTKLVAPEPKTIQTTPKTIRKKKKGKGFLIILGLIVLLLAIRGYSDKDNKTVSTPSSTTQIVTTKPVPTAEIGLPIEIKATYRKYADEPNTLIVQNKTDVNCHIELQDETGMTVLTFDVPVGASQIKMPVGTWKVILQFEGEEAAPCDDEIFSAWDATEPVTLILDFIL